MPVPKFAQYEAPTIRNVEHQVEQQIDRLEHQVEQQIERRQDAGAGLVVYGADWCGWTQKQKKELASAGMDYKFVDCTKEECPGITGFPTLQVAGEQHPGYKDPAAIKTLLGQ